MPVKPVGSPAISSVRRAARFAFRDGRIVEHRDRFGLWLWLRQALGVRGALLGWSPLVHRLIRAQARKGLDTYRNRERDR
jgi:hypothetical protein